jgi:hypothetical protein
VAGVVQFACSFQAVAEWHLVVVVDNHIVVAPLASDAAVEVHIEGVALAVVESTAWADESSTLLAVVWHHTDNYNILAELEDRLAVMVAVAHQKQLD